MVAGIKLEEVAAFGWNLHPEDSKRRKVEQD